MKFWPQKKWTKIILVFVLALISSFVAYGAFAGLLMSGIINREVVSGIDVINADGGRMALVVYQPGFIFPIKLIFPKKLGVFSKFDSHFDGLLISFSFSACPRLLFLTESALAEF